MRSSCDDTVLKDAVNPVILLLKCFGLAHCRGTKGDSTVSPTTIDDEDYEPEQNRGRKWTPWKIYQLVVCLFLWLNACRTIGWFNASDTLGPTLYSKIMYVAWFLQNAAQSTIMFQLFHDSSRMPAWISNVLDLQTTWNIGHSSLPQIKKRAIVASAIGIALVILNFGFNVYILFTPLGTMVVAPVDPQSPYILAAQIYCLISALFEVTASFLPFVFFITVVHLTNMFLDDCLRDLKKAVKEKTFYSRVHEYRAKHFHMCKLVTILDTMFSAFIAVNFMANLVLMCIILYNLIGFSMIAKDPLLLITHLVWFTMAASILLVISVAGASMNEKAHQAMSVLHELKESSGLTGTQAIEMQLFLNKLSGPSIGVTAYGIFVIDKPTILTLFGMFATYFVILVQFGFPSTDAPSGGTTNTNVTLNANGTIF